MDKLKGHIIYTINRDGKDIDELVNILKWALKKAEDLQDLKNECELNGLENQTNEQ
jgi:CRISPR/Cas system CSM-associated protein Csm2 small subunit